MLVIKARLMPKTKSFDLLFANCASAPKIKNTKKCMVLSEITAATLLTVGSTGLTYE